MSLGHGASVVRRGLLAHFDAANPKSYPGSGNTWYDLSGNARNITKAGSQSPTYPAWNSNGYFTFTGGATGDAYSYFNLSLPALSEITIEVFHYSTSAGGHIVRANNSDYEIGPDGYTAGTNYNDINCARADTLNVWIHDALTFNGTVLVGYRNGTQYSTKMRGTATTIAASTARIGTRDDAYTNHYVGNMAVIKFYSSALTAAEIKQNFEALRGRYGI